MGKLIKPPGMYVIRAIFSLLTLTLLLLFALDIHRPDSSTDAMPQFTDVRIAEIQLNTKPAKGVEIYYVPRNETSTFVY